MSARPAGCPSDATLTAFGHGTADPATAAAVSRHLPGCEGCRRRLTSVTTDFAPALPAAVDAPPELTASGQYTNVRELGRGGMGVVYLARNVLLDRDEVLKVVGRERLDRPGAGERFLQEIRAAAKLHHPNVVSAFAALQMGELLVFAMEYVPGEDLARVVHARGPLPVHTACGYAYHAALGLQHAHEKGMVHRDIKPSNLILARGAGKPAVKVLDFGLAKAARRPAGGGLTETGQVMGTPDYMAPEQYRDTAAADTRADIYALGCTLHYLLTGRPPFAAGSLYELLKKHEQEPPPRLDAARPDVPAEVADIAARMMAKRPADRFPTPGEVAKALQPFVLKPAGPAKPADPPAGPVLTAEVVEPAAPEPMKPAWRPDSVFRAGPLPMHTRHLNPEDFDPPARPAPPPKPDAARKKKKPARPGPGWWVVPASIAGAAVILLAAAGTVVLLRPAAGPAPAGPVAVAAAPEAKPPAPAPAPIPPPAEEPFVPLFNGKDLTGWTTHPSQPGGWAVENGELVGRGPDNTHLYTAADDFADVHVRAEVMASAGCDGGLFARSPFGPKQPAARPRFAHGYEVGVRMVPTSDTCTGSLYVGVDGPMVKVPFAGVKPGEWFRLELLVEGNRIVSRVNDSETARYIDDRRQFAAGRVALLVYGPNSELRFRSVEVRRLKSPTLPPRSPARPLPTADRPAAFSDLTGATADQLQKWADTLPAGMRPVWLSARHAADPPLFDAVALPDPDGPPWRLIAWEPMDTIVRVRQEQAKQGYWSELVCPMPTGETRLYVKRTDYTADWNDNAAVFSGRMTAAKAAGEWPTSVGVLFRKDNPMYKLSHTRAGPGGLSAFDYASALTAAQLDEKMQELRAAGGRPRLLVPHAGRPNLRFFLLSAPNTPAVEWDYTPGLSEAEYKAAAAARRQAGQVPLCLTSGNNGGVVEYTVVWADDPMRTAAPGGLVPAAESRWLDAGANAHLARAGTPFAVDGNELRLDSGKQAAWLFFGDPDWTDYDFTAEVKFPPAPRVPGAALFVRANHVYTGRRRPDLLPAIERFTGQFAFASMNNSTVAVEAYRDAAGFIPTEQKDPLPKGLIRPDVWFTAKVKVRGDTVETYLNDKAIHRSRPPMPARGGVGVRVMDPGQARFRNIRVTAPDGRVLWDKLPELPN